MAGLRAAPVIPLARGTGYKVVTEIRVIPSTAKGYDRTTPDKKTRRFPSPRWRGTQPCAPPALRRTGLSPLARGTREIAEAACPAGLSSRWRGEHCHKLQATPRNGLLPAGAGTFSGAGREAVYPRCEEHQG
ncbi:hypothetical protein KCP73_17915 [Salmonella enterica subsp. enterica]|nr:hypothetical protein KCP73_17915 [Salmonella enterica subsp. enterica]